MFKPGINAIHNNYIYNDLCDRLVINELGLICQIGQCKSNMRK